MLRAMAKSKGLLECCDIDSKAKKKNKIARINHEYLGILKL